MDPAKRELFEKYGVFGLAAVFLVVFVTGPAKTLGLFKSAPAPAGPEAVTISQPIGDMMAQSREEHMPKVDEAIRTQVAKDSNLIGEAAYTASALRDPFLDQLPKPEVPVVVDTQDVDIEPVRKAPEPPKLSVQGIIWGGPKPHAIINDLLYGVNDMVKGAKVVSIDEDGVTMDFQGTIFHLKLSSGI